MQDAETFGNMPASLAAKVRAYAEQTAADSYSICKRYHVPQDIYEAFIMDVFDILRAQYTGLRATTEQMKALTDAVPLRAWGRTENAALCFMSKYYADISGYLDGSSTYIDVVFINAVEVCEIAKRTDVKDGGGKLAESLAEAQRLYYTYAVLTAAEFCDATEDELRGIQPYGGIIITDEQRQRAVSSGLEFQRQRQQIAAAHPGRQAAHRSNPADDAGGLFDKPKTRAGILPADKTITQFQSIAYMIGSGIETADAADGTAPTGKLQPLWQAIDKQKQAAAALLNDDNASPDDKKKAEQLKTTQYAVVQVIDALQILPQTIPPDSGTSSRMIWEMPVHEYARIVLGGNASKDQVTALLKATAFLSTQRMAVVEHSSKYMPQRDAAGDIMRTPAGTPKRKKVTKEIVCNFQPVVVEFRTEYKDKVLIENATRIRIEIHRLFVDGRSRDYYQDGKKRDYIDVRPQLLTVKQYYDFSTENERIFRNIILSRAQLSEDALLSSVFNYQRRQAEADKKAADARADADKARAAAYDLQRNPAATPEQIAKAQLTATGKEDYAAKAETQAKYYIRDHMGDDVKRLKAMFEKALQNGLINSYYDTGRVTQNGKTRYGRGVAWHWLRGKKGN